MNRYFGSLVVLISLGSPALGQNPAAVAARAWRQAHENAIVSEFVQLLSIPDVAADSAGLKQNAAAIQKMLEQRGVKTRLLEAGGSPPVVYGEIATPGATRTVVLYAHYDGQPVALREWATPPFQPTLRDGPLEACGKVISVPVQGQPFNPEWRLYGRASGDDKAPIVALVTALDALRDRKIAIKQNVKFIFEGEEEAGSPHFTQILQANKDLLRGDVWLICDGPVHPSRQQQLVFGVRGVVTLDVTLYGARRELHSGHYGNWSPNPAMMMAHLLASMKDDSGHVLVDHFYDGIEPLGETEKRALAEFPNADEALKKELWLGGTEGGGKRLAELINLPSLNVRGMASARVGGEATNVVPSTATATIDMRLVKGIDPPQATSRVIEHIRKQGYFIVDHDPSQQERMAHEKIAKVTVDQGEKASRTSMELPISRLLIETVGSVRKPLVLVPTLGGTLPLATIEETLGTHTITVPIANHDNNQHTFNENLRLQNLWDGIELMAALLSM